MSEFNTKHEANEIRAAGQVFGGVLAACLFVLGLIFAGMAGCPKYNVWTKTLKGQAALKEAEWNRQIEVEEAQAKAASAEYLKQAELTRAEGAADAIAVLAGQLEGQDEYLLYLWIQGLHDGSSEIIYIPTEANMPVMEASRFQIDKAAKDARREWFKAQEK